MRFQIGAMSVGDILDRGLKLLLARLPTFYLINLIVLSPALLVQLALPTLFLESAEPSPEVALGILGGTLVVVVLLVVLAAIGSAAVLYVISQEIVDNPVTIGNALAFALRRFGSLFVVSLLYGLVVSIGILCLCVVPGLLFGVWFAFAAQVVVVEGLGPLAAFERSRALTAGFRWRVFGVFLLLVLIQVLSVVINQGLEFVLPAYEQVPVAGFGTRPVLKSYPNHVIHLVVNFLVSTLVQTYYSICLTLLYFDLRIRKEGFDLELAAKEQAPVVP
jgi:hypothetical protein